LSRKRRLHAEGLEERRVMTTYIGIESAGEISEDGGSVTFTIWRSGPDTSPLTIGLSYDNSETTADDFTSALPSSLELVAESVSFTVSANNDNLVEGNETLVASINIGSVPDYDANGTTSAYATIVDNDTSSGSGSGGGGSSGSAGGGSSFSGFGGGVESCRGPAGGSG